MGISYTKIKKRKADTESCMENKRNFGVPSGQIIERESLNPDLYMKVGTRVGLITAYYEHVTPSTSAVPPTSSPPVPPVRIPTITPAPALEQTTPIYDSPKKANESSTGLLSPNYRP